MHDQKSAPNYYNSKNYTMAMSHTHTNKKTLNKSKQLKLLKEKSNKTTKEIIE